MLKTLGDTLDHNDVPKENSLWCVQCRFLSVSIIPAYISLNLIELKHYLLDFSWFAFSADPELYLQLPLLGAAWNDRCGY